jgi:peptidoglycan hydrolase-like protein with peptidoglycan-binding domain
MIRSWLVLVIGLFTAQVLHAEGRVAFVVGNSDYENTARLANPANDARLVARSLEAVGFDVTMHLDLTRAEFGAAISDFMARTDGADISIFYFAGHGLQLDGENYLLPTDASLRSTFDVLSESISLSTISEAMRGRADSVLLFIDACRDNPLAETFYRENFPQTRSAAARGLAPVRSGATGSMVMFAASPGQVAYDGLGANSPFSLALARHLPTPNTEILTLTKRITADVRALTQERQHPIVTNDIAREIYLKRSDEGDPDAVASSGGPEMSPPDAAGSEVLAALSPPASRTATPWMEVPTESATANLEANLTPEQRRQIQLSLGYLGTSPGEADGRFGPQTRKAILAARQVLGLPPANHVSRQLLELLPDVGAIEALKSERARRYTESDLTDGLDPRLSRALLYLSGKEMRFGYLEGRLYIAVQSPAIDWHTSSGLAVQAGGHLATLTTAEEQKFVADLVSTDPDFFGRATYGEGLRGPFIGLFKTDAGWEWVTGEPLKFAAWAPDQPDNTSGWEAVGALHISRPRASPRWDDVAGTARGFIIEVE